MLVGFLVSFLAACALADQSLSGGGIFMKIQGQSGKMTFASSEPVGSAPDRVQIQMAELQELDAEGNVLGGGGNAKHSFNSFATQDFTFGNPTESVISGVEMTDGGYVVKDYAVTTVDFTSYLGSGNAESDSKLQIQSIIFKEDATLRFKNPDGTFLYQNVAEGTVKFNVLMSQWNWCENDCTSGNGVGASVRLTIEMINEIPNGSARRLANNTVIGCNNGVCPNAAVENLGGVFLSVLSIYDIQAADGTKTQYMMPKNPTLTMDPPLGLPGISRRMTTLVLEFPRGNLPEEQFSDGTLIYDPTLSYAEISDPTVTTVTETTTFSSTGAGDSTSESDDSTSGSDDSTSAANDGSTSGAGSGAGTTTAGEPDSFSSSMCGVLIAGLVGVAQLF